MTNEHLLKFKSRVFLTCLFVLGCISIGIFFNLKIFSTSYAATYPESNYQTRLTEINQSITVAADSSFNVAAGKPVMSSIGPLSNGTLVTDGDKTTGNAAGVGEGLQWLQIDLGQSYRIHQINVWHYFGDSRIYHDVIIRVSNDSSFSSGVTTVFNNDSNNSAELGAGTDVEYAESSAGKSISFSPVSARYVRLYSNGSTANIYNHYVEAEVWTGDSAGTLPGVATLNVDNPKNTGNYTITATIAAGDAATSIRLYEGSTVVLTQPLTANSATAQTFTYAVTGKAAGSYVYRADLSNAGGTTPGTNLTVTVTADGNTSINVAAGKSVTSSVGALQAGITDGDKNTGNYVGLPEGSQWIQIDLGQSYSINKINVWHYFGDGRSYHDVIIRVSNDPNFTSGITVFNNDSNNSVGLGIGTNAEYAETSAGKSVVFSAMNARYVRLYSNGSTSNVYNHYVEVEIWTGTAIINNPPDPAGISVDNAYNTGNYIITVTVPAGNTATSMSLCEGNSVVLAETVTPHTSVDQTFTHPVTGKANGTYVYQAILTNAYGSTPSSALTVAVGTTPPVGTVMFDDFNYTSSSDSNLSSHGWSVRTGSGGPGPSGCTWSADNVTFVPDPQNSGNKLLRLISTTNGSNTVQAELDTQALKYLAGTYAARIRFTDAPLTGPDGDQIVETFYTISPLNYNNDPTYSEEDFEYLANGGWGVSGPTMWMTSWYTYTPDPWSKDNVYSANNTSFAGWHTLVLVVAKGQMKFYIDGVLQTTQGDKYYPRKKMSIDFNLWFISGGTLYDTSTRTYVEDVDWVFHAKDTVLTPDHVNAQVQNYRVQNINFIDNVN